MLGKLLRIQSILGTSTSKANNPWMAIPQLLWQSTCKSQSMSKQGLHFIHEHHCEAALKISSSPCGALVHVPARVTIAAALVFCQAFGPEGAINSCACLLIKS
eukprot:gnl/MRDRNA2_/MRDRNA2_601978_c0_seq1.p1 gnl/MRDRNA2_/MRDRNA2_601978_c0~~gnl/MRDRNA2_/MRDRNA2_601978_c0_seq1.p1  ORF type:complete len:103 (-),score=12.32 gnl/MRDRNA2_/MRDRNA2_601978_c0_seq1:96-404(-)